MGWIKSGLIIVVRAAIGEISKPVGIAMDIVEATVDVASGNYIGAAICVGCIVASAVPGGRAAVTAAKGAQGAKVVTKTLTKAATKNAGKEASKTIAKKVLVPVAEVLTAGTIKEINKEIGKQTSKKIAMGASKEAVVESAKAAARLFGKDAVQQTAKKLAVDGARAAATETVKQQLPKTLLMEMGKLGTNEGLVEVGKTIGKLLK